MSPANEPFTFSYVRTTEEEGALSRRLSECNLAHSGASWSAPEAPQPVHVSARGAADRIIGGLVGTTHTSPYWLNVSVVWVDEAARKRGVGSEVMRRAEQIARQRGGHYARLETSNYQALLFYMRLGYGEDGRLDDCRPGETVYYLRKNLAWTLRWGVPHWRVIITGCGRSGSTSSTTRISALPTRTR
ncbi:MAG TPA: GNAT family N-acetyltransferase, partial [Ktedonobacterales bacterium]|nr:GNAT family N-acetyltransferase [Ktedonobacterales bacterium]